MSLAELAQHVGQLASWTANPDMEFEVQILNVKTGYGRTRYLVRPVAGTGSKWVDAGMLTIRTGQVRPEPVKRCYRCGSPCEFDAAYLANADGTYQHIGGCPRG